MKVTLPKAIAIVLVITIPIFLLLACEKRNGGNQNKFHIGMVTFAGYAPLYLAKEKGFFGDLDVELSRIEEIANLRAGVSNGSLDAYLATTDIALDTDQVPPGVSIWAIDESAGGDGVVVSSGISDFSELKGKVLAAEPGLPPYFILTFFLNEQGLSLDDIEFKDMSTQDASTAFISGAVAGAGLYEPYLSTAKDKREGSRIVISTAQTPGLVVDQIFASANAVANRKADLEIIINGWIKAVEYIKQEPEDANKIMAEAFGLPVEEFTDIASAVKWLGLEENIELYNGSGENSLKANYAKIKAVLKRNRATVYDTDPSVSLSSEFVDKLANK